MGKILYFEGAGMEGTQRNDVENCRIRTAFTNDKGKKIYLELMGTETKGNHFPAIYKNFNCVGFVSGCFYITDNKDDENNSRIKIQNESFEYTKENILNIINNELSCSFEGIVILENLAGYRVFREDNKINKFSYGDVFQFNNELTEIRKRIYKYFYELEKSEGVKYPNFSLWVDENDIHSLHLLRHFNGYNKHWSIRTDIENWNDSIQETKLGKYAC